MVYIIVSYVHIQQKYKSNRFHGLSHETYGLYKHCT